MGTPEEDAKLRADVMKEMEAEETGETLPVDADPPKKDEEKVKDPWEGVDPALKQIFDEMSQRVSALTATESRLKQAESRIGAITNELHAAKTVKVVPTKEEMAAAVESDEKWGNLKKDFPEWAEAFDGRFDKKLKANLDELKADIIALKEKAPQEGKENIAGEIENRLLTFFKPKWKETVASKEWQDWLAMQPPDMAGLVKSEQAADAVKLIDAFESSKTEKTATEIAAERKQRLKTSELPKGGKATPVKSEADMNASELRANIGKEVFSET
jgi:hypothetical protein